MIRNDTCPKAKQLEIRAKRGTSAMIYEISLFFFLFLFPFSLPLNRRAPVTKWSAEAQRVLIQFPDC